MTRADPSEDPGIADGDVRISSDPTELDIDWIHDALSRHAYWALGRSRERVETSIRNSICFGAHLGPRQIGFARVVTDEATFAWICDVYVDEAVRGRGVGSRLMEVILADVRLGSVRRMLLATTSAAALYERFGFAPLEHPERWLERRLPPDPE